MAMRHEVNGHFSWTMKHIMRLTTVIAISLLSPLASAQVGLLQSGSNLVQPTDIPPTLYIFFQTMGSRMASAALAQVTLNGTTTDARGSRSAQIIVQAPGFLSYREGTSRAITFNGSQLLDSIGTFSADDQRVAESLLAHLPDAVFLQVGAGGTLRRVGSHFIGGTGASWTVYAFSPRDRTGLVRGNALQQELFICIDETTGLIGEIRVAVNTAAGQQRVVETQLSNWSQQNGQWFPGQIVRLENGNQTLSFNVQQAAAGSAATGLSFQP
jgi:hypothetical protein